MWDTLPLKGDEKGEKITGQGTVCNETLTLEKVNLVPELYYNMMSVSQVCDKQQSVLFNKAECLFLMPGFIIPEDLVLLRTRRRNNTYIVDMNDLETKASMACLLSKASKSESLLWHLRLGHVNFKNINRLVKQDLVRDDFSRTKPNRLTYQEITEEFRSRHFGSLRSNTSMPNRILRILEVCGDP
ncbi:hypothetical protein L1987_33048 [Smallanthus sonchifolius]|uniref:Uncharacterized protein n=1 Tax=Smallanthus sonchifolius TaxID=185202 RepID=A0ACB9HR99_9ASTR|nr:hypothetical protein L1987_33048 [Smallanthus sonchifolius]